MHQAVSRPPGLLFSLFSFSSVCNVPVCTSRLIYHCDLKGTADALWTQPVIPNFSPCPWLLVKCCRYDPDCKSIISQLYTDLCPNLFIYTMVSDERCRRQSEDEERLKLVGLRLQMGKMCIVNDDVLLSVAFWGCFLMCQLVVKNGYCNSVILLSCLFSRYFV